LDPQTAGEIASTGSLATFTASTLSITSHFTISASYEGISNSTGTLINNAQVDTDSPEAPGQPTLEVLGPDSIKLTWTPSSDEDIDKYIIQRSEKSQGPWENIEEVDSSQTSYTDENLKPGTMYYYKIVAMDDSGNPSEGSHWMGKETYAEMPWLLLILIIVIITVILSVALAAKKKKNAAKKKQQAAASFQAKTKSNPPKSQSTPQRKSTQPKKPSKIEKELPPPPSWLQKTEEGAVEKTEEETEVQWQDDEEMPPPPPPPET
jgi:hypothetical protein